MEVILKAPIKIGGKNYKKTEAGKTENLSSHLAYNNSFKNLVKAGTIQVVPLNEAKQKIRLAHDAKAHAHAKAKRKASIQAKADKLSQAAQGTSSAPTPINSSVSEAIQPNSTQSQSSDAGVAETFAPAIAQENE